MSETIDLRGTVCPMPVLKTKKALATLPAGGILEVLTDDPHAVEDLKRFSEQSGHVILSQIAEGLTTRHRIQKKE